MNPNVGLVLITSRRLLLQTSEIDNSSVSAAAYGPSSAATARKPSSPIAHFDSTMTLTILILLTALFFLGFYSVYIRRSAAAAAAAEDRPPPPPPHGRKGLDPSAVRSLPLVAYGDKDGAAKQRIMADDDGCPICLTEFQEGESVRLIPYCGHVFHPGCIDTWLASHVTCPLCRSSQLFKKPDEEGGLVGCDAGQV